MSLFCKCSGRICHYSCLMIRRSTAGKKNFAHLLKLDLLNFDRSAAFSDHLHSRQKDIIQMRTALTMETLPTQRLPKSSVACI